MWEHHRRLSPFPFTLYTSDFHYISESAHLQKFPDDSAVVGCISDGREEEYKALVSDFVEWSGRNHHKGDDIEDCSILWSAGEAASKPATPRD